MMGLESGNIGLEKRRLKISMKALLIAIVCVAAVGGLAAAGCGGTETQSPPSATASTPSGTPQPLRAPEFSLPSAHGGTVSLSALLNEREGAALVFYRGFF